ncbi:MAG TPA: hypothetical protein VLA69_02635 [Gaiellaceae bacterium]|nr:hypothetical protein [Gaiellaceae bacterium]
MSRNDLSLFSYEILGLVGRDGAGPHDLRGMVRRGRVMDWAGESQYYAEPKRLAKLGYLEATKEPGKTRERTVYRLTGKGLHALREYAETPARFTALKSEPLVRLLIADLVGERATREGMAALRSEIDDLLACVERAEASARALPHRQRYLHMVCEFQRQFLALHLALVDEVERELGDAGGLSDSELAAGAVSTPR